MGKISTISVIWWPKKDLGICFPDIHSKSAGCIEKGVFPKYFISVYVILQFKYLFMIHVALFGHEVFQMFSHMACLFRYIPSILTGSRNVSDM